MRTLILALTILAPFCARAATDQAATEPGQWTWGLAAGSPQVLAVTLEKNVDPTFNVQGHVGTIVLVSSAGIRAVVVSPRRGFKPYFHLGLGGFYTAEGDGGGALGFSGYGWCQA